MSERLSQVKLIYYRLLDGDPHSNRELAALVMSKRLNPEEGGLVRISERIREIQKQYGVEIIGFHDDKIHSLYWYQMGRDISNSPVAQGLKKLSDNVPLEEMPEYDEYNRGQQKLI